MPSAQRETRKRAEIEEARRARHEDENPKKAERRTQTANH